MTITFTCLGDSHLDDMGGIGARSALSYLQHFRKDAILEYNRASKGSRVVDWQSNLFQEPLTSDVYVVSSGWNEGVCVTMGTMTMQEVRDSWYLLIEAIHNAGRQVLWIPTQYQWGRAPEFWPLEELFITPICLGADKLLERHPEEFELSPDGVHRTFVASWHLALEIYEAVVQLGEEGGYHDQPITFVGGPGEDPAREQPVS